MEPKTRKLVAKVLLFLLIPSALASLVGGGLLVCERYGYVQLQRVPNVSLLLGWTGEKGDTVAIVNTDVTGGAFVVCFSSRLSQTASDFANGVRVWVPPRSIVLTSRPGHGARAAISHHRFRFVGSPTRSPLVISNYRDFKEEPKLVPRGRCVALQWHGQVKDASSFKFVMDKFAGVSLVPTRGLAIGRDLPPPDEAPSATPLEIRPGVRFHREDLAFPQSKGPEPEPDLRLEDYGRGQPQTRFEFSWDGSAPALVKVESTTPGPSVFIVYAEDRPETIQYDASLSMEGYSRLPAYGCRPLLVYDTDMTVIDERSSW